MVRIAVVGPSMRLGHRIWESGRRQFRIRTRIDPERLRALAEIVRNVMTAGLNPGSIAVVRQCLFPKNSPNLLRPEATCP